MRERVCVIVNPAAGRGRGARILAEVRSAFDALGVSDIRETSPAAREDVVARRAIDDGCTTLVAVGGDGTWSNVANAILHRGSDCRLALVAAGTGNDFAKTVGAPARDVAATARLAVEGPDQRVDVGRIEQHYFLNVAGFGLDVAVLEDVANIRWLRGDAVYIYSALRQLVRYRGMGIDVATASAGDTSGSYLMVIVANARNFGGSFRIAPDASITDGELDAVCIRDAPPLQRLRLFLAATRGTHTSLPQTKVERSALIRLRFAAPPSYETDGEYRRAQSAELEIRCMSRALRVVTPVEARRDGMS